MWKSEDFKSSKAEVIKIIKKKLDAGRELHDEVTSVAQSYGIPIVVVLDFVIEELPEYTESCEERIKMLKEFYGIRS